MSGHTEDELLAIVADYESTKTAALTRRDEQLRAFYTAGWRPVDLQRVTGYSRETIRQALHPDARRAANTSRRGTRASTQTRPPADYVPYADRKPYVVPTSLSEMRGPRDGIVALPHHLDWSGSPEYDLSKPARLASMYKVVLAEASSVEDLRRWLNGQELIQIWPTLWLPAKIRQLWEDRFPELAASRAAAAQ